MFFSKICQFVSLVNPELVEILTIWVWLKVRSAKVNVRRFHLYLNKNRSQKFLSTPIFDVEMRCLSLFCFVIKVNVIAT